MDFVSTNYESFKGQVVSDVNGGYTGQCVSYVKRACPDLGATPSWRKGPPVKGRNTLAKGTAIATFDANNRYLGHAAIYVSQNAGGLQVWDQWVGHPVAPRNVSFRGGKGNHVNDGDQYYVIE